MTGRILVVGGSGTVGRELLTFLVNQGISPRVLLRPASKLPESIEKNVEIIRGDLSNSDSLRVALNGMEQVFLLTRDQPLQAELEENLIVNAEQQSVRRIIKSSAFAAGLNPPVGYGINHARIEQRLMNSQLQWVIQRPFVFMQNFLDVAELVNNKGILPLPFGKAQIALIDARDVALAAGNLLLKEEINKKIYELTGPESLSLAECSSILSDVLKKKISYRSPPFWFAGLMMKLQGVSWWDINMRRALFRMVKDGGEATTSEDFQSICETRPRDFRTFAMDYAEDFLNA